MMHISLVAHVNALVYFGSSSFAMWSPWPDS